MNKRPIWLVIDGTHHVYRDLYASDDRDARLLRPRLHAMFDHFKPDRIVAAFDCGPSFRSRLYPEYKGDRTKPEGIDDAIAAAKDAYLAEAVDLISVTDFEADDILCTVARIGRSLGNRIVIASADKDMYQCILDGEATQMIRCLREGGRLVCTYMTAKDLKAKYDVNPSQWVDYRCLIGDKSDNIDGIHGIGSKTAGGVIAAIGSLDAFYANPFAAGGISSRIHAKLLNAKRRIPLLRELLTLRDDVPLPDGWS